MQQGPPKKVTMLHCTGAQCSVVTCFGGSGKLEAVWLTSLVVDQIGFCRHRLIRKQDYSTKCKYAYNLIPYLDSK